jgi:hypothetical protein
MRDIGAQHLICVSTEGFPESIHEDAKQYGGAVRLVWLKTEDVISLPIKIFNFNFTYNNNIFEFREPPKAVGVGLNRQLLKGLKIKGDSKRFYYSGSPSLKNSLDDLIKVHIQENNLSFGEHTFTLPVKGRRLFILVRNKPVQVQVICSMLLKEEKIVAEKALYNYEQAGDGTLAWTFRGECKVGNRIYIATLPAIPLPNGTFNITGMAIEIIQLQ